MESEQIFQIPKCDYPESIIVKYGYWCSTFDINQKSLLKKFERSLFPERGIDFEEFRKSLMVASNYIKDYRGRAQNLEKFNYTFLTVGLLLTVCSCLALGVYALMIHMLIPIASYIILAIIINKVTSNYQNKYLRQGHLLLALVCRNENNRLYLKHRVEMRPGFLGKWI